MLSSTCGKKQFFITDVRIARTAAVLIQSVEGVEPAVQLMFVVFYLVGFNPRWLKGSQVEFFFFSSVFRPHCMHTVNKMRPVAVDVARCVVCASVCLCVGHTDAHCKIG